jgi:predicted pyridoxine 5'-phosphate oxidase superfamily flavin-nucleotide-binding protein
MAQQFDALSPDLIDWIGQQHIFFVATAARDGRVNLSPKGQDSLRVTGDREIVWVNLTGSGNETAAHLLDSNRMTLMWCAFEGLPRILRVYGSADTVHPDDAQWQACARLLPPPLGARQYFRLHVDLVQTSCGYAVPLMAYQEDRQVLTQWAEKRGADGIRDYWQEKNRLSIDGLPTGIQPADVAAR